MAAKGTVQALHIAPAHFAEMEYLESVELLEGLGVSGDRNAKEKRGPNSARRQVLLMDQETLDQISLKPGTVRENITTSGLTLYSLEEGQRLSLGPEAVVEITQPCAPCQRMEQIRPGLQKELEGRQGMLARVLKGGKISVGDAITVL